MVKTLEIEKKGIKTTYNFIKIKSMVVNFWHISFQFLFCFVLFLGIYTHKHSLYQNFFCILVLHIFYLILHFEYFSILHSLMIFKLYHHYIVWEGHNFKPILYYFKIGKNYTMHQYFYTSIFSLIGLFYYS